MFACATICFALVWKAHSNNQQVSVCLMVGFAILFRLIGVYGFPLLEDDFYRYLWDGMMTYTQGSPYGVAPAEYFLNDQLSAQFETILNRINYPEVATIYGPSNQWIYAFAYWLNPGDVRVLQAIAAFVDILLILLLLRVAKPNWVLLYAWSPLVIKELAFTAHTDGIGLFFLFLGFLAYRSKRYTIVGCSLALAAGIKVFALMAVPLLCGKHWRAWLSFVITAVLIALPFGLVDSWLPEGLKSMSGDWLFNAPLYFLLQPIVSINSIKIILISLFLAGYGIYYLNHLRKWPAQQIRFDYLFALAFLCLPAFNAWYWLWLLPFAVIYPSAWAWVGSVSVFLAYMSGINLAQSSLQLYEQPLWAMTIEFTAIALAAFWRFGPSNSDASSNGLDTKT